MPTTAGIIEVVSPTPGQTITTTDIPVVVRVSNFTLAPEAVGRPDVDGEGHIHVMLDGMNMGVLFNFYTSTEFTLPGDAIAPGEHTLIFDLASNTHMDFANTVQQITINYQPAAAVAAPAPATATGASVAIVAPADHATVGATFELTVSPTNFQPSLGLEGKENIGGYGHYHVFVDMQHMDMAAGAMMSMAGMVAMPGTNVIPLDLSAWPAGEHTITVELVQNDHTPLPGAAPAMITINLAK
ncbi:MAG: hypothetical protein AB7U18_01910 [Dehalococcoidia bacterium]